MRWLVALLTVSISSPAAAVCYIPSLIDAASFLDGREDVPTNAVLVADLVFSSDSALVATPLDGGAAATFSPMVSDGVFELRPDRELLAEMDYELCANDGSGCVTFRTTSGPDRDEPASPLASITDVHGFFALDTECGGAENVTVVVINAEPDDDAVALTLSRSIGAETSLIRVTRVRDERAVALVDHAEAGGEATYEVVAVDLAGNRSEPTQLVQSLGCTGSCAQADANSVGVFGLLLWAATTMRGLRRRARQRCRTSR